jgi:hypothetical protein
MINPEELIIYAAILGLLMGIIWALRYIVLIDKKLEKIDKKIERTIIRSRAKK